MFRSHVFPALLGLVSLTALATAAEVPVSVAQRPDLKAVFGQVESRDVVPARARIGGTVTSLSVEEGSAVKAGDVIARVVDDKLALQLNAVDARIKAVAGAARQRQGRTRPRGKAACGRRRGQDPRRPSADAVRRAHQPAHRRGGRPRRARAAAERRRGARPRPRPRAQQFPSPRVPSSCRAKPSPASPAAAISSACRCLSATPATSSLAMT